MFYQMKERRPVEADNALALIDLQRIYTRDWDGL